MMSEDNYTFTRRKFLQCTGGLAAAMMLQPQLLAAEPAAILKAIPKTGEQIPVIGMGSWITFDVGTDARARADRVRVLQEFFDHGGGMIDSSPMYGSSEAVIGHCLKQIRNTDTLFSATKVWIVGKQFGINQMNKSFSLWDVPQFDLMQIHNMLSWETHLETLKEWKREGRIRYIGITTSHGRRHEELEAALKQEDFDFVQFTYNILDREVEQRLLPLAAERGIAVIINRPFRRGDLFGYTIGKELPEWTQEFDCHNWAQFLLKFIVSHPAVTCTIPATSRVEHMRENMGAGSGKLPDAKTRQKMIQYFESIV
jgi:diketogulonate reductase-like aldo/keto reductase